MKNIRQFKKHLTRDLKACRLSDPSHIFLISFPKSGATWLNLMLSTYFMRTYSINGNATINLSELTSKNRELPNITWTHEDSAILFENGERPDPERLFTYGWRFKYIRNKIVLLVRDPRDVVVSHYHQITKRSAKPMRFISISDFVRDPIYGFDRIIRFYNIWDRNRRLSKEFLLISYEELLEEGVEILEKVVGFVDKNEPQNGLLEEIYNQYTADKMRMGEVNQNIEGMRKFSSSPNSLKVRKAKAGSYMEELTNTDLDYCNDRLKMLSKFYPYAR